MAATLATKVGGMSLKDAPQTDAKRGPRVTETQQQLWDAEMKNMPRPDDGKNKTTTNPPNSTMPCLSNFFRLKIDPKVKLYRYSIILGEWQDPRPARKGKDGKVLPAYKRKINAETKKYMVTTLLAENAPLHDNWATDFDSFIISVGELYKGSAKTPGQEIPTPHTRAPKNPDDPKPIVSSSVKFLNFVDTKGLLDHVAGKKHDFNPDPELQAYNTISWCYLSWDFNGGLVKNKFYPDQLRDKEQEKKSNAMEKPVPYLIRGGFFTSMRPGRGSVLFNVNTTTSAFYAPVKLSSWIKGRWRDRTPTAKDFDRELKDVRVTFDLHEKTSRKWVLNGIAEIGGKRGAASKLVAIAEQTFDLDGRPKKVYDYLIETYPAARNKLDKNALCINVGGGLNPVWLPADMLTIVDWQIVKRVLPDDYTSTMVRAAEHNPQQNQNLILNVALNCLNLDPKTKDQHFRVFGFDVDKTFVKIDAIKSLPPKLLFNAATPAPITQGAWNLSDRAFNRGAMSLQNLGLIFLGRRPDATKIIELRVALEKYGVGKGIKIGEPVGTNIKNLLRQQVQSRMNDAFAKVLQKSPTITMLLIVLEDKSKDVYGEVKRWADCTAGIPTVCVTQYVFNKAKDDVLGNLSLKFNLKLGGINHRLHPPTPNVGMSGAAINTMIVGADCTHPGQHAEGCPSMAAVVATVNDSSGHFLASARLQRSRQEFISDLEGMMFESTKRWHQEARKGKSGSPTSADFPSCILFYRDGVSESQYGMVRHEELPQIKKGCLRFYNTIKTSDAPSAKWDPKITLIVVTKRHNTRFYPTQGSPTCKGNLLPGALVDKEVVAPNQVDFYLQSHASPKGTARSSHYIVIEDEKKYTLKQLEDITHALCYIGARATKALSICAPAQFADMVCNRLRFYMKPCLDGKYPDTSGMSHDDAQSKKWDWNYVDDGLVWNGNGNGNGSKERKDPWHERMDGIMFYL